MLAPMPEAEPGADRRHDHGAALQERDADAADEVGRAVDAGELPVELLRLRAPGRSGTWCASPRRRSRCRSKGRASRCRCCRRSACRACRCRSAGRRGTRRRPRCRARSRPGARRSRTRIRDAAELGRDGAEEAARDLADLVDVVAGLFGPSGSSMATDGPGSRVGTSIARPRRVAPWSASPTSAPSTWRRAWAAFRRLAMRAPPAWPLSPAAWRRSAPPCWR